MNDVIGTPPAIVGGMGAQMDDNQLGEPGPPQAGLEIGVMDDKVGFRVAAATGEPIILLFSVAEMYNILAAIEMSIAHIRKSAISGA